MQLKALILLGSTLFLFINTVNIFAENIEYIDSPRFAPLTPEVTAQGGSFTAISEGHNALFTNPAGFAKEKSTTTLLSITGTSFFSAEKEKIDGLAGSVSFGYVGNRLGLGIAGDVDFYEIEDNEPKMVYTWGAVGGLSFPFEVGPLDLYAGGDVRFMLRSETSDIGLLSFINQEVELSDPFLSGPALAIDAGVIAEYGAFAGGLSFRDIGGTQLWYQKKIIDDDINNDPFAFVTFGGEDSEGTITDTYAIPMSANIGFAYKPELDKWWAFEPKVHAEYQHVFYRGEKHPSILSHMHMGAEIGTLKFLKLRAGFNGVYPTAGLGLHLLFLDLNVSYFTQEMGSYEETRPNSGVSLEASLRF